jgi:hypothetical protein
MLSKFCLIIVFIFFFISQTPNANSQEDFSLFHEPSDVFDIPENLLWAIAKVESRVKPWALNIEGRGAWFNSKDELLKAARVPFSQGRSFDLGLMQINSRWLKKFDIPLEAALDPLANVYLGAWLLRSEFDRLGDLKSAIGSYHSPSAGKANKYVDVVLAALKKHSDMRGLQTTASASDFFSEDNILEGSSPNPLNSPILVVSPSSVLVNNQSMKVNFNQSSMKVNFKSNLGKPK